MIAKYEIIIFIKMQANMISETLHNQQSTNVEWIESISSSKNSYHHNPFKDNSSYLRERLYTFKDIPIQNEEVNNIALSNSRHMRIDDK